MTTQSQDSTTYAPGARVTRTIGPMMTGMVVEPTRADRERRYHVHGVRQANDPMALVQWGYWRSWEYCADLRPIPGTPGDL
jgi:hypothetical protein